MRLTVFVGALSACACGTSFDHVDYQPFGDVPSGVLLEPRLVSVPVGISIAARVTAVNDNGDVMLCEPNLVADDDTVMTVERADRGSTVFTGISVGHTSIFVHCGDEDGTIAGSVTNAP